MKIVPNAMSFIEIGSNTFYYLSNYKVLAFNIPLRRTSLVMELPIIAEQTIYGCKAIYLARKHALLLTRSNESPTQSLDLRRSLLHTLNKRVPK